MFETAEQAVNNITAGWNLGNTFDSYGKIAGEYSVEKYETLWHSPVITREMITAVRKAGFNAMRLPVTWDAHADEFGNIRKEWLERVAQVAGYALDEGMYCIINVHHDSGPNGWLYADEDNFEKNSPRFAGIWRSVAEHFRDYGEKLMFEGFNEMLDTEISWTEPKSDVSYDVVNRYNKLFVDTVRSTGGNNSFRNLVIQTYSGGESKRTLNAFILSEDSIEGHLIAQVHNYDPQGFCWIKAKGQVLRDSWGSEEDIIQIDRLIVRLSEFRERISVPVIIGEYGSQDKGNEDYRAAHAGYLVSAAAAIGVKCFWWDTTGEFGLLDRAVCKMICPKITAAICDYESKS